MRTPAVQATTEPTTANFQCIQMKHMREPDIEGIKDGTLLLQTAPWSGYHAAWVVPQWPQTPSVLPWLQWLRSRGCWLAPGTHAPRGNPDPAPVWQVCHCLLAMPCLKLDTAGKQASPAQPAFPARPAPAGSVGLLLFQLYARQAQSMPIWHPGSATRSCRIGVIDTLQTSG